MLTSCRYKMGKIKFFWKEGSKFIPGSTGAGFFLSVAIAGVTNGVGKARTSGHRAALPLRCLRLSAWLSAAARARAQRSS
jgi:hypothetical protein